MLGADVAIAELVGGRNRLVEHHSGSRRVRQIRRLYSAGRTPFRDHALHRHLQIDGADAEVLENVHDERVLFCQKAQKEVFRSHVFVMAAAGVFPRLDKCPAHSAVKIVAGQQNLLGRELRFLRSEGIASL